MRNQLPPLALLRHLLQVLSTRLPLIGRGRGCGGSRKKGCRSKRKGCGGQKKGTLVRKNELIVKKERMWVRNKGLENEC